MKLLKKIVGWGLSLFLASSILAVVVYKFLPVYVTPLMVIRLFQQAGEGESLKWHHTWVPMDEISPHMPVAV
ncbi:MAG: monofunctional biosynthetic peptidoglycan transglycosylase, partial [Prevotella sp.]|nr:monofunctional biosynthetic peptidoglycan transglycosylase [Prevotella sp.]